MKIWTWRQRELLSIIIFFLSLYIFSVVVLGNELTDFPGEVASALGAIADTGRALFKKRRGKSLEWKILTEWTNIHEMLTMGQAFLKN